MEVTLVAELPGGLLVDVRADDAMGPVEGLGREAAILEVEYFVRVTDAPNIGIRSSGDGGGGLGFEVRAFGRLLHGHIPVDVPSQ